MGIRETLNQKPQLATAITLVILATAVLFPRFGILWYIPPFDTVFDPMPTVQQLYYTTDNGQTTFVAPANRGASFDHDGKEAVRAYVFSCDKKKTRFVGYLERMNPDVRRRLSETPPRSSPEADAAQAAIMEQLEVKRPADAAWVKRLSPEGAAITQVDCEKTDDPPEDILPGD